MLRLFLPFLLVILLFAGRVKGQNNIKDNDSSIINSVNHLKSLNDGAGKADSLLRISNYYINKPGSETGDIQAANKYAEQALNLAIKLHEEETAAKCYTLLSQIRRESGHEAEGKKFIQRSISIFEKLSAPGPASKAYFEASSYYNLYSDSTINRKIDLYSKGLKQLERSSPQPVVLADALKMMGDLYQFHGDYSRSLPYLKKSLSVYQQAGVKTLQDIYVLLGDVLAELQDLSGGIKYILKGVNILEANRDMSMTACQAYFNLGITYGKVGKWDNALKYLLKANHVAKINKDSTAVVVTAVEIASAYRWLGRYDRALQLVKETERLPGAKYNQLQLVMLRVKIYDQLHQYANAAPYFQQLTEEVKRHDLTSIIVQNGYIVIFEYMIATRQFEQANKKLNELLALPLMKTQQTIHYNFEQLAFKADSAQGNLSGAMAHLKKATTLKVALMKVNYDNQIGRLQMEFESNKKDQDIAFKARHIDLLTKQNELQKSSLKYQGLVRNLLIAGAGLLILMLGISYNRYQIKKTANHELEEQQEEINTQNESLRLLLIERDWLLKEVHHRVKNNLQIVISLLNSQLNNIKDVVAKDVIRESQHRMHAISLIHQRLYQDEDTAGINIGDYVLDLTNYLQDSFGIAGINRIKLEVAPLMFDVAQAVPLGLILNEAVTNAFKYAFNGECPDPCLTIALNKTDEQWIELIISDNGQGLPSGFEPDTSSSLGMKLIIGLTKQLKGEVDFISGNGLRIHIKIPLQLSPKRSQEI